MGSGYDVLFFSAHPDDVEFGMGGTYLKIAREFKAVHVILTRGEAGTYGTPEKRVKEAVEAGKYAGADVEFLDFKDNHVEDNAGNAKKLAAVIRKHKPKIIFSPYHSITGSHKDGASHPDHIALGKLVLKAARFAKFKNAEVEGEHHLVQRIFYYMVPRHIAPSAVVDVSDVVEDLKRLWKRHKTQLALRDGAIVNMLLEYRRITGKIYGMECAEHFMVDEPLRLYTKDFLRV
jgi:N-acetylglucosamine malate deacetylase 1